MPEDAADLDIKGNDELATGHVAPDLTVGTWCKGWMHVK